MNESFEVEIHPIQHTIVRDKERDTETVDLCERYRYKAQWIGRQYMANNIVCHISAVRRTDDMAHGRSRTEYESRAPYEDYFLCHSHTLDGCISEAESILRGCLFGKAELLDGKYRVATVTKRYGNDYWTVNSNLTHYGEKCKKSEPKD